MDRVSCKPDFNVLLYPGALTDKQDASRLAPELRISAQTPPTFIAVAADDKGCADCSVRYWQLLKEAGVKSELHVYATGGHGFGIRESAGAISTWPARCLEWMRAMAILPAAGAQ